MSSRQAAAFPSPDPTNGRPMKVRLSLENIANIAVIAAAATFITLSFQGYLRWRVPNSSVGPGSQQVAEQLVGKRLPLAELKTGGSEGVIVLVLAAQCRFCQDSAAFYRRLSSTRRQGHYALVAVFSDSEDGSRFLNEHHIEVDQLIAATPRAIGASATPTVLVLGRSGEVHAAWVGRLSAEDERSVVDAVRKVSSTPLADSTHPRI